MFKPQSSYTYDELIQCGQGKVFGPGNAQLPLPNMLMVDRITLISKEGGMFEKGEIKAELDINPEQWFFGCHFQNDPVMPGCLGLDALWQLLGFYLAWLGNKGRGRALGCGKVRFYGQILPNTKKVTYHLHIQKTRSPKVVLAVGYGEVFCDDEKVYTAEAVRSGLFVNI